MKPRFVRSLMDKFYDAPPIFAGGYILNLLGYHIIRVLFFSITYALRKKKMPADRQSQAFVKEVLADGLVVIPNFFPAEVFEKIKKECDAAAITVVNERAPHIKRETFARDNNMESNPIFERYLAKNDYINQIVSAVVGKDILITPRVQVELSYFHAEDLGKPTTDVRSDNLHFDVSYPTMKCFLYLSDIDERNAAFTYVKGSHKMTWQRLWMEYKMSVRYYRDNSHNETPEVSSSFIEKQGMQTLSVTGEANTLIIVNTMGFHKRGTYKTTIPRYLIALTYRE